MRAQPRAQPDRVGEEDFWYVTLGPLGGPPTRFLLDNNVISIAESLLARDFRPTSVDDRRMLRLIERCVAHPQALIEDGFSLLEGSSIHDPTGINPASLCKRSLAVNLIANAIDDVTLLVGDRGLLAMQLPDDIDKEIAGRLDASSELMASLFVPGYVTALVLEDKLGQAGPVDRIEADTAEYVLEHLDTHLNFVPRLVWHTVLAATLGDQQLRQAAMGVLKTGSRQRGNYQPSKNALSAGWDLALMQLLSTWVAAGERPVLVTNDRKLGVLANALDLSTYQGQLPASAIAPQKTEAAALLSRRYMTLRGLKMAAGLLQPPDRNKVADTVRDAERLVGVETPIPDVIADGITVPQMRLFCDTGHLDDVLALSDTSDVEQREARMSTLFGQDEVVVHHLDAAILLVILLVRRSAELDGLPHSEILAAAVRDDVKLESELFILRTVSFAEKFVRPSISHLGAAFTYQAALVRGQFGVRLLGMCYLIGRLTARISSTSDTPEAQVLSDLGDHARRLFEADATTIP